METETLVSASPQRWNCLFIDTVSDLQILNVDDLVVNHKTMEWFGLEQALEFTLFQPPYHRQGTFL